MKMYHNNLVPTQKTGKNRSTSSFLPRLSFLNTNRQNLIYPTFMLPGLNLRAKKILPLSPIVKVASIETHFIQPNPLVIFRAYSARSDKQTEGKVEGKLRDDSIRTISSYFNLGPFISALSIEPNWYGKTLLGLVVTLIAGYMTFELNNLAKQRSEDLEILRKIQALVDQQWDATNTIFDVANFEQSQPLLQLYSHINSEQIKQQEELLKKINQHVRNNQRLIQRITEIKYEMEATTKSIAKRAFMRTVLRMADRLLRDLNLQNQQLKIAAAFSQAIYYRKQKNFPLALQAIEIALQELAGYKQAYTGSDYPAIYTETLKTVDKLVVSAYNHKAKIHRALAGSDLEQLDKVQLELSRESYETALKLIEEPTVRSSLGFLLNDMSAGLSHYEDRKALLVEAKNYHEKAKSEQPQDPNIRHGLAYDLYKIEQCQQDFGQPINSGNLQKALDEFGKVQPPNARLYHDRGLALLLLDRKQEALADFNQGLVLEPNHLLLLYTRGQLLKDQGEYVLALTDFKRGRMVSIDEPTLLKKYDVAIEKTWEQLEAVCLVGSLQEDYSQFPSPLKPIALTLKAELDGLDIRRIAQRAEFEEVLEKCADYVKQLKQQETTLKNSLYRRPVCFISYAWGNAVHEAWVERFSEDLERAGIEVLLDRWYDRKGKDLMDFVEKIGQEETDFVVVVGTQCYLEKYKRQASNLNEREPVVGIEGRLLDYAIGFSRQRSKQVIPVVLEGPDEKALPLLLRPKLNANFWQGNYFEEFLQLVRDIHGIGNRDKTFRELKEGLNQVVKMIEQETPKEVADSHREAVRNKLLSEENNLRQRAKTRLEYARHQVFPAAQELFVAHTESTKPSFGP